MSKTFFRFLRGELNGFYIQNINQSANEYTKDIKKFLSEFKSQQFEYGKIDDKSLYGLGTFAGIFLPRLSRAEALSSIRMTESHIENGFECSERGLFDTNLELFQFFHCADDTVAFFFFIRTSQDSYNNDINTQATNLNRTSLVGNSDTVLGYISSEETDLFDEDGNVKPEKVLSAPPAGVAYSEYYGDEFLLLSEGDNSHADNIVRIRMTDSMIVGDVEYSERGLFVVPVPMFADDINTLATSTLRSSLVGEEDVLGYISSEETNVLDDNGNVRHEKISVTPPADVAYSDFFGNQFLFLSEAESSYSNLEPSLYIELFKAMQWVRYNGASISSLGRITSLICPDGLVKLGRIEVASDKKHINVYYDYDDTVDVNLKQQRLNLLEYIVKIKFVQVTLVENI